MITTNTICTRRLGNTSATDNRGPTAAGGGGGGGGGDAMMTAMMMTRSRARKEEDEDSSAFVGEDNKGRNRLD